LRQNQTNKQKHYLLCTKCGNTEVNVDIDVKEIVCHICCAHMGPTITVKAPTIHRPRGWHKMPVFVDQDGNVFHKGIEKPELKGTLKPTKIKQKIKDKKSKFERVLELDKKELELARKYKERQNVVYTA